MVVASLMCQSPQDSEDLLAALADPLLGRPDDLGCPDPSKIRCSAASTPDTAPSTPRLGLAGEEPLIIHGIDDELPKRTVSAKSLPDPASPKTGTAPLGSPARVRAPDGDGAMMSVSEASFTLLNFLMNVGQFTLPVLFVRHGWSAVVLIVIGSMLCAHTALLMADSLVQLMRRGVPTPDYAELAVAAVGQNFALLAHACSMTELLTYNCMNLIALGKGVVSVFPMLSMETAMCLCIAISIGLSAVPDRHFAYIALIAALAILAAEGTCVLGGLELPEWEEPELLFSHPLQIPSSFALIIFAAGTHPLIPCLMHNTGTREDFRSSILIGWAMFTAISLALGGGFFYIYGFSIQPLITDNTGRDLSLKTVPGGRALQRMSGIWVSVKLLAAIVPVTRPVSQVIARKIGIQLSVGNGGWRSMLLTLPTLTFMLVSATFMQNEIARFESLIGGIAMGFNALTFPTVTYLQICRPKRLEQRMSAYAICALGMALPVFLVASP